MNGKQWNCVCIGGPLDGKRYAITTPRLSVPVLTGKTVRDQDGNPAPQYDEVVYERFGDVLLVIR